MHTVMTSKNSVVMIIYGPCSKIAPFLFKGVMMLSNRESNNVTPYFLDPSF